MRTSCLWWHNFLGLSDTVCTKDIHLTPFLLAFLPKLSRSYPVLVFFFLSLTYSKLPYLYCIHAHIHRNSHRCLLHPVVTSCPCTLRQGVMKDVWRHIRTLMNILARPIISCWFNLFCQSSCTLLTSQVYCLKLYKGKIWNGTHSYLSWIRFTSCLIKLCPYKFCFSPLLFFQFITVCVIGVRILIYIQRDVLSRS